MWLSLEVIFKTAISCKTADVTLRHIRLLSAVIVNSADTTFIATNTDTELMNKCTPISNNFLWATRGQQSLPQLL